MRLFSRASRMLLAIRPRLPARAPRRPACYVNRMSEPIRPHHPAVEEPTPEPSRATFGQTLSAVLWSFFGVRKGGDMRRDAASINPVHIILIGVACAALLVIGLIALARYIAR
jgi:Protein of unknown function (DUF2970)